MNVNAKRRLVVVTGLIAIVIVIVFAVVSGNAVAKPLTVAEACSTGNDAKIQVTGNVVKNSFAIENGVLNFKIYDSESDPMARVQLDVRYDGSIADTFGNDVVAICTGKKNDEGTLICSELVTKCPSKYENADDAISIDRLLGYGDAVIDSPVKVSGIIEDGSLSDISQAVRFTIVDEEGDGRLAVIYDGALPDAVGGNAHVLLVGSLGSDGNFRASSVALEG